MPVKQWNFRKAKWSHYNALTNQLAKSSLPPDTSDVDRAYQDFCNSISTAAKKYIPCGRRNDHIPCWDAECENLYQMFLQLPEGSDSSRAASALLSRLDRKRRDRWSEAVQTIDFSHSSRKAWSILNNLTGKLRRAPQHCAVSANAIASVLVNNSKYEDIDSKTSRLVSQKVSDLWRASTTSAVNVCGSFTPSEFAAALKHLKPGKTPGPDSYLPWAFAPCWSCPEIMAVWLSFILFAPPQNSKNLEKSIGCRDPQTNETCRGPQELLPHLFALCPLQDPREAHLHPYRAHCRPASSSGASWVPTGEVHSRPNCSTYPTHRGLISDQEEGRCCFCRSDSCLWHCLASWSHL